MRELTMSEIGLVAGAGGDCGGDAGNSYGGVSDTTSLGSDLIEIYEALVEVTSHVIERVADAF